MLPAGDSLPARPGVAVVAAVAANLVDNLPATLIPLPMLGAHPRRAACDAARVDIGPNLTCRVDSRPPCCGGGC